MAKGHRLNISIVLAVVHGLSGLFRAVSAVEPSLFRPLPPLSPSLISRLASVDVKQNGPAKAPELRTCVKVDVAVLGSLPLSSPYGPCGGKATLNLTNNNHLQSRY